MGYVTFTNGSDVKEVPEELAARWDDRPGWERVVRPGGVAPSVNAGGSSTSGGRVKREPADSEAHLPDGD